MPPTLFLDYPSIIYRESFLAALQEFHAEERNLHWDYDDTADHFERFVQTLRNRDLHPPPGKVRETIYWLINDHEVVGRLSLRHRLNNNLLQYGGNIGYEIRPSCRRRGYGKTLLRLGLEKAKAFDLHRVLITCDDTNSASAKIIEANGGVLENLIQLAELDAPTRRYWITLQ